MVSSQDLDTQKTLNQSETEADDMWVELEQQPELQTSTANRNFTHADGANAQKDDTANEKGEFNVVPYFSYNSTLGAGFGAVSLYSFHVNKEDEVSPKSTVGVAGIYTTNNTLAVLGFGSFYLDEDKWRVMFGAGYNEYNFQTYFDAQDYRGSFVNYDTKSFLAAILVRRKIIRKLYFGLGYIFQDSKTEFEDNVQPEVTTKLNTLNFELFRDVRDDVNYPRQGSLAVLQWRNTPEWLGNDETINVLFANYNQYIGVQGNRDVLAFRFHLKAGLGELNFQQQPVLGGIDLRGYSQGKYRGDGIMDIQGEYRWNFENKLRLSAVGFAGVGTLYGSDTEDFNWKAYPSVGAGIRWTALTSNHFNVGIDAGFGKDDWGIYFRFNEAF